MSRAAVLLRPLVGAAAVLALFAGMGGAQELPPPPLPPLPGMERPAAPSENAIQRETAERVYRTTMKNIPDRKVSNDPWRTVRTSAPNPAIDRHRPQ